MVVAGGSVNSASADPSVSAKRAQAQDVLIQIREIDSQLSYAVEAFNLANVKLDRLDSSLRTNGRHLVIAQSSLKGAQSHLEERLVQLYVSGGESSTMEVLLGAKSLDDLLSRLDAVERVSDQDARVLREVKASTAEIKLRKLSLERARKEQAAVVSERASRRGSIEGQLQERQQMLTSIKGQIAQIEAVEARKQAQLEAQARARLAAAPLTRQVARQPQSQALAPQAEAAVAPAEVEPAAASSTPAPAARYGGAVGIAMQFLGVPYRWGGADPSGFDCSGLIMFAYAKIGVSLPHNAAMQYGLGSAVSKDQLQPGDLVFFDGLGHNGMYIGGGQFIHAPKTGDVVKISSLSDSWYAQKWVGARRL